MRPKPSDQQLHALYCPLRHIKSASFLVAYFFVVVLVNWKNLHKTPQRPGLVELFFEILVVAMLMKWMVSFTCFSERLVFGLVIVSTVAGVAEGYAPAGFIKHAEVIRSGHLALSLLGLVVSLRMLLHSARSPRADPAGG